MDNETPVPKQINGDNVLRLDLDLSIDYRDYERIPKVWGEEIVLCRHKFYTCKLLVVNAGYKCSNHRHIMKDETFICVKGFGRICLHDDIEMSVKPGDKIDVPLGTLHYFSTRSGMVLMEVSTYDDASDSIRLSESRKL